MMEPTLTLSLTSSHLRKISTQHLLLRIGDAVKQDLTFHYFDTDGSTLRKRGLSLRIVQHAAGATQTLTRQGARHRQWETVNTRTQPDLLALSKLDTMPHRQAKLLRRLRRDNTMVERFVVRIERGVALLDIEGAAVEVHLDDGTVTAGMAKASFCEIGLARQSGKRAALYAAARQIARHIPVQLSFVNTAQRGHALLGHADAPVKAQRIVFPAGASVEQGMRRILAACLVHAQSNVHGFLCDDDAEYLHQLRVGLRRFRSALKLFRDVVALPEALDAELGAMSALLGAARDADVLLSSTLARFDGDDQRQLLLEPLLEHAKNDAAAKLTAARAAIRSTRYAQSMLALFEWVDCKGWRRDMSRPGRQRLRVPLNTFARHAVLAAHARVAKRAGTVRKQERQGEAGSESLHRLRIAGKQSRYAVEFFEDIERPGAAGKYVKQLSAVQDALGAINDIHVAQAALAGFSVADAALAGAVEQVSGQLDDVIQEKLAARRTPWKKLDKPASLKTVRRLLR